VDDLVVLNAALNFVRNRAVVLFVKLILESIAELLDAILDELGVSVKCCHGVE
jgi:hypothetical protein